MLVSHAMDEIERLCDRVVMLDRGAVLTTGTPQELRDRSRIHSLEEAFLSLRETAETAHAMKESS